MGTTNLPLSLINNDGKHYLMRNAETGIEEK
jgi:2-keto-3-deoxy-galactonokinase